ncbi:MAG TPA: hypothetical protein VMF33_08455 [Acidimicrobiales bacterium]|nr:hypothetical protein [Acidimicrobiales bacterium]
MTSVLDDAARCVMDVLRGERSARPTPDTSAAARLRGTLEGSLAQRLGDQAREEPITVSASSLRHGAAPKPGASAHASLRGILLNQALRLLCAGAPIDDVYRDALYAWRAEGKESYLRGYVDQLGGDDAARLRADVEAHWVTLKRSLGSLSSWWLPRTSLRAYQRLAQGNVILRDLVDLMVGTTSSDLASVVILDVTTSPLDDGAERVLRYHALVQTLRTGVVPLRSSMFCTATGELRSADVDVELLSRSVDDVLSVIDRLA